MKFTLAFIMATAALTSATAINMDPAAPEAPAKWDNLRIQFSHDFDCKTRKKGKLVNEVPKCNSKDYKKASYMFHKKDETQGKCFSPKDLQLLPGQENWHSMSFCLPPRLQKTGCEFRMYDNIHCEGDAQKVIYTKDKEIKSGECENMDEAMEDQLEPGPNDIKVLNQGGLRSIKIDCPARQDVCDGDYMEEADEWSI